MTFFSDSRAATSIDKVIQHLYRAREMGMIRPIAGRADITIQNLGTLSAVFPLAGKFALCSPVHWDIGTD